MGALSDNAGILLRIRADSSQAEAELRKFAAEILGLSSSTEKALSGISLNAVIASAAIVGIGTAAIGAAAGIFELTKTVAEAESKVHDMAETTGLSATTISALKYAADTSGASIEQVAKGLTRFTLLMGEAAGGSDKAAAKLKFLNVTSTDLNVGLGQAIKTIAEMPPGIAQVTAASDAFGKKLGADLIPTINSFRGDLPGLIKHLEDLGLIMSDADVKAGDEFGDTLDTLHKQAGAVARVFAQELMPSMTHAMQEISKYMAENKGVAEGWGRALIDTATGAQATFSAAIDVMRYSLASMGISFRQSEGEAGSWGSYLADVALRLIPLYGQLYALISGFRQVGAEANKITSIADLRQSDDTNNIRVPVKLPSVGGGGGGKGGGGGGKSDAAAKAKQELEDQIQLQKLALASLEKEFSETMKRIDAEFKKTDDQGLFGSASTEAIKKYTDGVIAAREEIKKLDDQLGAGDTYTKQQVRVRQEAADAKKYSDQIKDVVTKNNKSIEDSDDHREKHLLALLEEIKKEEIQNSIDIAAFLTQNAQDVADKEIEAQAEIIRNVHSTKAERIAAQEAIFTAIQTLSRTLTQQENIDHDNNLLQLAEEKRLRDADIEKTVKDDEKKKGALLAAQNDYDRKLEIENDRHKKAMGDIGDKSALPVIAAPLTTMEKAFQSLKAIGLDAFNSLAQGIGNLIQNWVLLGTTGPNAMRKLVASVLAGVAAQSAVLAIFELAKGFAALFWNPAEAAAHFHAAALFGILAVGAGLAGRAVAGNAFQQQTAGGGASGGTGAANNQQNNFTTGFSGFIDPLRNTLNRVDETLHAFAQKFEPASPGDVLQRGAHENPSAILHGLNTAIGNDGAGATGALARATGQAR